MNGAGTARRRAAGAVLLAAAGGAALWWASAGGGPADPGWVRVERGELVPKVEVTGTLKAVDSSVVSPPSIPDVWDLKISFMAPEGKLVKAGEPVLGFDTSDLERRLEEKLAESEAAKKKIDKKRGDIELRRKDDALRLGEAEARRGKAVLKTDVPPDLAASSDLHKSKLDLEEAEREIAYLRAKIASDDAADAAALAALEKQRDGADRRVTDLRAAIAAMTLKAPREGTVVYVTNWRDEKHKVGDSVWRGERIVEIPDLRRMEAKAEVDEADAGRLQKGQRVVFRLDAHPDVEFRGSVASIWSTVQRKSWQNDLKVVRLDLKLDETDERRMRPGMRFRGSIETTRIEGVVRVPLDAVFPSEDGPVAYRKTALGWTAVRLKLGRRDDAHVEVLSGLAPGDRVAQTDLAAEDRREGRG